MSSKSRAFWYTEPACDDPRCNSHPPETNDTTPTSATSTTPRRFIDGPLACVNDHPIPISTRPPPKGFPQPTLDQPPGLLLHAVGGAGRIQMRHPLPPTPGQPPARPLLQPARPPPPAVGPLP